MSTTKNMITRLRTQVDAYPKRPEKSPASDYVVVFDTPGIAAPHRADGKAHWSRQSITVMGVGRTDDGCRAVMRKVRALFENFKPHPTGTKLTEVDAGNMIADGPSGDIRYSMSIVYQTTSPAEEAL